jgi:hypothetical protein
VLATGTRARLTDPPPTRPSREREAGPLRISVLSQMDPRVPPTHSIAAIRLCSGLAHDGHAVELLVPAIASPTPLCRQAVRDLRTTLGAQTQSDVAGQITESVGADLGGFLTDVLQRRGR